MDQTEFEREMRLLQDEYTIGLKKRLSDIKKLFKQLVDTYDDDVMQQLFREVHSLTGSAATFGFAQISVHARSLESLIRENLNQKKSPDRPAQQKYQQSISILEELIEKYPDQSLLVQDSDMHEQLTQEKPEAGYLVLVEDDEILGREMKTQLEHMGFTTELFVDALSVQNSILNLQPDAIIIDIMLPEGEFAGTELATLINELHDETVPVVFISARGDWKARLAAVRAGGKAYITKPVDYSKLANQLDRITQRVSREPYRVLIVDDTVELARHYALMLEKTGMYVEILSQPEEVLKKMVDFKPDLLVLDLYMPEVSGIEVANVIRQHEDLLSIPIVFLSTEQDRNVQLIALQEGDDFLQKPVLHEHFTAAITSRVKRARVLNTLMHRDGLTGLLNHSALKSALDSEVQRAQRNNQPLCFVMLDLDKFKHVNDTYGHPVGDRVLKGLSRLLSERLRKTDQIGRYGGEEFAIILPETELSSAFSIMEMLRKHFAALIFTANGSDFHCTFSAGIAQLAKGDNASGLNQRADEFLYVAKKNGRNRVVPLISKDKS